MGAIPSQITSLTIVHSTFYSDVVQRKHHSSASLAFVWGIHRGLVNSQHKWPVTWKMFPFSFDETIPARTRSLSPEGLSDKPYDAHNECPGGIWRIRNTNNTCNSPFMMTSSNGNIFRVTGHLCGEFTDHRWISCTKASDAELWCLLWFAHE